MAVALTYETKASLLWRPSGGCQNCIATFFDQQSFGLAVDQQSFG